MFFRSILKSIRFLLFILFGVILLFCLLFLLLQTQWAKFKIREKLLVSLEKIGITADLRPLQGSPPFSWKIQSAELSTKKGDRFDLEGIKFRIAFLPLLRGKFTINYLSVEKVEAYLKEGKEMGTIADMRAAFSREVQSFSIPYPLAINHMNLAHIILHSPDLVEPLTFELQGKFRVYPQCDILYLSLALSSSKKTFCDLLIDANRFQNRVDCQLKTDLMGIPLFFPEKIEGELLCNLHLNGSFASFKSILHETPLKTAPLRGELKVTASGVEAPWVNTFASDYKIQSRFSIQDSHSIRIQKFLLASDFLHLNGKGILSSDLLDSQMVFLFSSPHLKALSPLVSLPLSGKLNGKGLYKERSFKMSFSTEELMLDAFQADQVLGMFSGKIEGNTWTAEAKISSVDAEVPFENAFKITYTPEENLSFSEWELHTPIAEAQGDLSIDFKTESLAGNLDANISDLHPFAPFFKEEDLSAELSLTCKATGHWNDPHLLFALYGNHVRYRDYLLDQCSLTGEISRSLTLPQGRLHLFASKIYSPHVNIDQLTLHTVSDEEQWPFQLDVTGKLGEPFTCHAKGIVKKEPRFFSLECTELFGEMAKLPFSLRYPTLFTWDSTSIDLTPTDFHMGKGKLHTAFELSPIRSVGTWKVEHFPLEILNILRPTLHLEGYFSSSGYLDARETSLSGNLNAVIEEASFLKQEKEQPLQAKGSIQAHLNDNRLQISTNLNAIDSQFLDLTGSFPVSYTLYPLSLKLEEEKPVSAELICEGKLEDLFDLVNLGINHVTGLVSSKLFLTHTLANPFLQGTIDWQHGTYENYFTGVQLRDIHAHCEAHRDTLSLKELTARDEENGTLEAEGKIFLHPKEHFPYFFTGEQHDLHVLKFNMIDCTLSGPLYFTGNALQATAQGNFLVDNAKIQLTEDLPYEIPSLPFTFIHRPPHLSTSSLSATPPFQFHIDLELTADDKVYVTGSGLNAELQGNVHLTGTNINIKADGALQLMKGEYQFSGKIFKLTEGEIIFKDKPTSTAYLHLNGTLELPNATVTAMLRGPLSHPQLSFQANPQLSTSSILAFILFNKDISEISHPEAIQLASVLMSLSGGAGPDVLETIRKTIGVDRLNIASAKPGSDEIAVQIGKYLTRGILVTLSQSATSTQVIVEVELPKGFVFQAETQEEQEGKFSLKWTRSY